MRKSRCRGGSCRLMGAWEGEADPSLGQVLQRPPERLQGLTAVLSRGSWRPRPSTACRDQRQKLMPGIYPPAGLPSKGLRLKVRDEFRLLIEISDPRIG